MAYTVLLMLYNGIHGSVDVVSLHTQFCGCCRNGTQEEDVVSWQFCVCYTMTFTSLWMLYHGIHSSVDVAA